MEQPPVPLVPQFPPILLIVHEHRNNAAADSVGPVSLARFYIRFLDPRTVLLTGLTRDGTFLIENGKVTRSLKNFRWNESPLFILNKIDEIGRAERTAVGQVMPALRVKDFNFQSLSDAV